jgi:hypothetical protein
VHGAPPSIKLYLSIIKAALQLKLFVAPHPKSHDKALRKLRWVSFLFFLFFLFHFLFCLFISHEALILEKAVDRLKASQGQHAYSVFQLRWPSPLG